LNSLVFETIAVLVTLLLSYIVANAKYQKVKAKLSAIADALKVLDAALEDDALTVSEVKDIYNAFKKVVEDP